jgi:hypothetical protein
MLISLAAAAVITPSVAFAQGGTATGAVGGAAVGAVVGGPVGAVVGGTVGAVVGTAAEPPQEVITYVERERVPSVAVQERVVVGEPLPATVQLRTVPSHTEFGYAVVNNQRVIVEPKTRRVVRIIQ